MPTKPADVPLEPHIARAGNNALQQTAPGMLGALRREGSSGWDWLVGEYAWQASKKIKKWILLLQRINNKMKQALRINIIPNHSTKISAQQIKYAAPGRIPLGIAL
ncbi:hypothetical protein MCI89_18965 [Muricomes sp. OA1]|uniref:Uncharacterized protein n=1 Tax=Hungatella hathewayi TaxID=154046 RepID=A0A3E2WL35_9FIRM|nr:hypothetical protein [Faecalicatena contorta]MCH1974429.1 hypothetical protein [Muricomes sp. OA1]RGC27754.1 hypothetical protein DWX41_17845 [Hungatella hathewayi]GKH33206.1 hypothetical protein CE91St64_26130 [Faecalicatena contorta]